MEYVYLYLMCGAIYGIILFKEDAEGDDLIAAKINHIKWEVPWLSRATIQFCTILIAVVIWLPLLIICLFIGDDDA